MIAAELPGRSVVDYASQACVRRRALISVRANPACPNDEAAERAVNEVWESCFNDTRPFDEVRVLISVIRCVLTPCSFAARKIY